MNPMLVIENQGEMDVNGLRLLGATSKEGQEGKIGFFGTGTKYAIASAFRLGVEIIIYSGEKRIAISTRSVAFRGESYDEILIDGNPTGITTRTGIQWQPWYIIREFLCNAIDEGGQSVDLTHEHSGRAGKTRVYIELNKELREAYEMWDGCFSFDREPYHVMGDNKCYLPNDAASGVVYRRGVKVWDAKLASVFDYDLHNVQINEARVATSDFDVTYELVKLWKENATAKMLTLLFAHKLTALEWTLNWEWSTNTGCEAWATALRDYVIIPKERAGYYAEETKHKHIIVPTSMCVWLHKAFGKKLKICGVGGGTERKLVVIEPDERQKTMIADAVGFLKFGGFADVDAWPILVADMDTDTLGLYDDDKIYIATDTFLLGRRQVVETLLEEYAHAKSKKYDETRDFQNVLIRFVINAVENKTGKYL